MDATDSEPDLSGEPDWTPVEVFRSFGGPRAFVSGDPDGNRLRVRYYSRHADDALVGKVWFGPGAEGPPDHAHGGSTAAVLDEAMGAAAWHADHPVVAAEIRIRYRRLLPLGTVALVETSITGVRRRRVHVTARLVDSDGRVFCDAEGTYVLVDERIRDVLLPASRARVGRTAPRGPRADRGR